MSAHHETLSPSSLPAILACARYQSAPGGSEWATMGTEHHREFAAMLRGNRELANGLPIEERTGVEYGVAFIVGRLDPSKLHIEEPIKVYDPEFEVLTWGTPDAWTAYGGGDEIPDLFDYKSGQKRDYAAQMAAYALGIMQLTGAPAVNVHIIYGRFQQVENYRIRYADAEALVLKARDRRLNTELSPTPCDYCGWCANAPKCPALASRANAIAAGREDWALEQYHASKIEEPAEMAKALRLAKHVAKWAEAVEHFAKEMAIKRGIQIPDFEIKERRGNREVADMAAAYQRAGLPIFDFLACCDVSLPALEVAYAKAKEISIAAAKKQLAQVMGEAVRRKNSTFNLKPKKEQTDGED